MQDEKLFRAKVSDFGLSQHMTAGQTHVNISQGSEAYLPMEVFTDFKITKASDVYALGVLMWEICYGVRWFTVWNQWQKKRRCGATCIDCHCCEAALLLQSRTRIQR
jgi:serine/threonine protein kinase